MKKRDILKYALAIIIAIVTIAAITGMSIAREERRDQREKQRARVQSMFRENNISDALPGKVDAQNVPTHTGPR